MVEQHEERIRLLSLVGIFEPLTEREIEDLNGQLPDRRIGRGEVFYGPEAPPKGSSSSSVARSGYSGRAPTAGSSPSP